MPAIIPPVVVGGLTAVIGFATAFGGILRTVASRILSFVSYAVRQIMRYRHEIARALLTAYRRRMEVIWLIGNLYIVLFG
jgi:hypothetical protein